MILEPTDAQEQTRLTATGPFTQYGHYSLCYKVLPNPNLTLTLTLDSLTRLSLLSNV